MKSCLLLLLAVTGCRTWPTYEGAFEIPNAAGILQPELDSPFEEPIGFVGNLHGGQIVPLALKQGRFLTDDATVSYLRTNPLSTGHRRIIAGVSAHGYPDGRIDVFALDRTFQQIVEIPYSTGLTDLGFPVEPEASVSSVRFVDADESGDSPALDDLEVKTGWTASEDWTVEYQGTDANGRSAWVVTGTRSGRMENRAYTDEPFQGTQRAIAFTIRGEASPGDRFEFSTDASTTEYDAGGLPLVSRTSPDQHTVAVLLANAAGVTELKLFDPLDPSGFAPSAPIAIPDPGQLSRVAWSTDSQRLFVADSASSVVWEIRWSDPANRSTYDVLRHRLPWPVVDVAPLEGEENVLYVAQFGADIVWMYNLQTERLIDINPWMPGVQGMVMDGPINGIEAMPIPYLQLERTDLGVRKIGRAVAVSLASGRVVFMSESTGCLVEDKFGPRASVTGSFGTNTQDYTRNYSSDFPRGAALLENGANNQHVMGNPCGGITREQNWSLRFDELRQGWRVTGALSGEQASLAYEDQRYISDDGEVSFTILSGQTTSRDGWVISFRMIEGITVADGDNNKDGSKREIELDGPGDPLYFHYTVGPDDQGWRPVDDRPFVLVPAQTSELVGRVMPNEGIVDVAWR